MPQKLSNCTFKIVYTVVQPKNQEGPKEVGETPLTYTYTRLIASQYTGLRLLPQQGRAR